MKQLFIFLLIIILAVALSLALGCTKEQLKEDVSRHQKEAVEWIADEYSGKTIINTYITHWHTMTDAELLKFKEIVKNQSLNFKGIQICPPMPVYGRWTVIKDTCKF